MKAKRYRYTGKERDEESGLYYHGARYYVPWLCNEEIPAIFIQSPILGLHIVLDGYSGVNEDDGYSLSISPESNFPQGETYNVNMDDFLQGLLKDTFRESVEIIVM